MVDRIIGFIDTSRTDPDSWRMLVSAWNVPGLGSMTLTPCHALFQRYVTDGHLSL